MSELQKYLNSGDVVLREEARQADTREAWRLYWDTVPAPGPHPAPNFRGHERNEFGKWTSRFVCATCGFEFTLCPALLPNETADANCLAPDCASYSIDRDPLALLALGEAGPITREDLDR